MGAVLSKVQGQTYLNCAACLRLYASGLWKSIRRNEIRKVAKNFTKWIPLAVL